jgi:SAM-dependent methyltransferase
MDHVEGFYQQTLETLLRSGDLDLGAKVFIACGGPTDKRVFERLGFRDVVISNIDTRTPDGEFAPFRWSRQDIEDLDFEDGSFDYCVVHSGLHHCRSPHKGLLELYRVAKKGVIAFEPLDNRVTRLGARLGFGQEYEIAAVAGNGFEFGGVRNTPIPNYVYRFTEREVVKTVQTFAPVAEHRYRFFYALRVPWYQLRHARNKLKLAAVVAALPFLKLFTLVFPRESNNFAFAVLKPSLPNRMHPWLRYEGGEVRINREWVEGKYACESGGASGR